VPEVHVIDKFIVKIFGYFCGQSIGYSVGR
jgi:hypothetical protein